MAREKIVGLVDIGISEHVLPRNEHLIHDEDRVVLIDSARQRVVERAAEHSGALFVRDAADEFYARRVGRDDKGKRKIFVLDRQ
jgi:hypothetical protein